MVFVRRFRQGVIVMWLAATLAFVALRVLPGDAMTAVLIQSGAGRGQIEAEHERLGLNEPIPVQYARYLGGLLRGDFGTSLLTGLPVAEMIGQQLVPTLTLAIPAIVLAVALGVGLGLLAALDDDGVFGRFASIALNVALSTPLYWTGTLAIYLFTVHLELLPSGGAGRVSQLVLPVGVLAFHTSGAIGRVVQANVRALRRAEFVHVARAKGLRERTIATRHVLRAGLAPVVAVVALQAGFLLSGVVVTESLFVRPGLGKLLLDSTLRQDYPLVQGLVLLSAAVYVVLTAAGDAVSAWIDPRVRAGKYD